MFFDRLKLRTYAIIFAAIAFILALINTPMIETFRTEWQGRPKRAEYGDSKDKPPPFFLTIAYKKANLRDGPGLRSRVIATYIKKKGLPVKVINYNGDFKDPGRGLAGGYKRILWYKIQDHTGQEGWMFWKLLHARPIVLVRKGGTSLYRKPDRQSTVVRKLSAMKQLLVARCLKTWCEVESGEYYGWVPAKYVYGLDSQLKAP